MNINSSFTKNESIDNSFQEHSVKSQEQRAKGSQTVTKVNDSVGGVFSISVGGGHALPNSSVGEEGSLAERKSGTPSTNRDNPAGITTPRNSSTERGETNTSISSYPSTDRDGFTAVTIPPDSTSESGTQDSGSEASRLSSEEGKSKPAPTGGANESTALLERVPAQRNEVEKTEEGSGYKPSPFIVPYIASSALVLANTCANGLSVTGCNPLQNHPTHEQVIAGLSAIVTLVSVYKIAQHRLGQENPEACQRFVCAFLKATIEIFVSSAIGGGIAAGAIGLKKV